MSVYGLIKATSRIQRNDTISDLCIVNKWRLDKGLETISPKSQSVKQLENAVALSINGLDVSDLPKLTRGVSFYVSILPEILKN
jgi:hypothetical protein